MNVANSGSSRATSSASRRMRAHTGSTLSRTGFASCCAMTASQARRFYHIGRLREETRGPPSQPPLADNAAFDLSYWANGLFHRGLPGQEGPNAGFEHPV